MLRKQEEALQGGAAVESWDGRALAVFDLSGFGWANIDYTSQVRTCVYKAAGFLRMHQYTPLCTMGSHRDVVIWFCLWCLLVAIPSHGQRP